MNALIIDIRETLLRAVLSTDGVIEYCRTFDFAPPENDAEEGHLYVPAKDNPYLLYYDLKDSGSARNLELKQILKTIRSDIKTEIDATHLIVSPQETVVEPHKLPKLPRPDAEKLIARKLIGETKEAFPPFSIIPGEEEQKNQTWFSVYVGTNTIQGYRRMFSSCRMRLSSITTPVNAMLDAFKGVREAIFNTHAVFEIHGGSIEAYYISADGLLHFERMQYNTGSRRADTDAADDGQARKQLLFKVIDTIFRINSHYQSAIPTIPVQMAWICGSEENLDEIAIALKEAMSIEVSIAPAIPTGAVDESAYVPLAGFASSLQNGTAITYSTPDFFRRLQFRRRSGVIIYAAISLIALIVALQTEKTYRALKTRSPSAATGKAKPGGAMMSGPLVANLEALKKLTGKQFVFYTLFRELANALPDGVYLDSFDYKLKEDKGFVDITAIARMPDNQADSTLLSRLIDMLDKSPSIKSHTNPSVAVITKDKIHFQKITVSCEVKPIDTTK